MRRPSASGSGSVANFQFTVGSRKVLAKPSGIGIHRLVASGPASSTSTLWRPEAVRRSTIGAPEEPAPTTTKSNSSILSLTCLTLAGRLHAVQQATKNALGKEDDENDEQDSVDQVVPANRLGAEADAQSLGQHDG